MSTKSQAKSQTKKPKNGTGTPGAGKKQALTQREETAIEAFVSGVAITYKEAYLAAYPRQADDDPSSVSMRTHQFFRRPHVQEALNIRWKEARQNNLARREKIIREYERLAFTDLVGIIDYEQGTVSVEDFKGLSNDQRACIKNFKVRTKQQIVDGEKVPISEVEITLHDKAKALSDLARIEQLITPRSTDVNVTNNNYPATQTQLLAALIEQATPEEAAAFKSMAARLTAKDNGEGNDTAADQH